MGSTLSTIHTVTVVIIVSTVVIIVSTVAIIVSTRFSSYMIKHKECLMTTCITMQKHIIIYIRSYMCMCRAQNIVLAECLVKTMDNLLRTCSYSLILMLVLGDWGIHISRKLVLLRSHAHAQTYMHTQALLILVSK